MRQYKDKTISQSDMDKITKYEEDFAKIQAATEIKDFEKLISIFVKNEEENFNMFKYVNELSNEIEDLDKQLLDLKEEKDRFDGQDN